MAARGHLLTKQIGAFVVPVEHQLHEVGTRRIVEQAHLPHKESCLVTEHRLVRIVGQQDP